MLNGRSKNTGLVLGICLFILSVMGAGSVEADTREVPTPAYLTIQSAIDASTDGDIVSVDNGTYEENISFGGKAITVQSKNGPDVTTIDGTDSSHVVTMYSVDPGIPKLSGFKIINGEADEGGGIDCKDSSPIIENCIIINNEAYSLGGGIYIDNSASSPQINNCTFINNMTSFNTTSHGGGLYLMNITEGTEITNCEFNGNTATGRGGGIFCQETPITLTGCTVSGNEANDGGGIYCKKEYPVTITDSTISDNEATYTGAGIYCDQSPLTMDNCIITGNTAYYNEGGLGGGGLYLDASTATITNTTISGNSARFGGGITCEASNLTIINCTVSGNEAINDYRWGGGGIFTYFPVNIKITNCTLSGNLSNHHGGGIYYNRGNPNRITSLTVFNSILWGNEALGGSHEIYLENSEPFDLNIASSFINPEYILGGGWANGGGNITNKGLTRNPSFADPMDASLAPTSQGDYHLTVRSKCIDAGDNTDAPTDDIDGETRPQDKGIDMGSDEFVDGDNDRIADYKNNCPSIRNHSQKDNDNDGVGNVCDPTLTP